MAPSVGKNLIYSQGKAREVFAMEGGAPQQPLVGPQQVDANQHQAESRGSQHSNPLVVHGHREIVREVHEQPTQIEVTLGGKAMFPT